MGRILPVMFSAIERGETEFNVGTRVWQPTWTNDLALNCLALIVAGARGRYQMAAHGQATFADVAEVIASTLGWTNMLKIVRVDSSAVAQSELGRRPDIAILSGTRLRDEGMDLQRQWQATLRLYLQHQFFDRYRIGNAV